MGPWGKPCVVASFRQLRLIESWLFCSVYSILLLISVDNNPALHPHGSHPILHPTFYPGDSTFTVCL